MNRQNKAYLYALGAVLAWSTVATAFKLTLKRLEPVELLFFSTAASTAVLGLALLATGKLAALRAFSRAQWLHSLGLGLLNPFFYYLILFEAYDRLPAQEAQPLNYTWAIVLAFLAVPLLGQKIRLRDFAAAFVCYFGVVILATHGEIAALEFSDPLGVALALGSTVIWALYWILNTKSRRDPAAGLFLNFLFSLPAVAAAWLLGGVRAPDTFGLLGAAYVGAFEMGITFLFWLTALKLSDNASKVGNLIFLSPFLSLVFIRYVLGEKILESSLVGLSLIIGGLMLQRFGPRPAGQEGEGK